MKWIKVLASKLLILSQIKHFAKLIYLFSRLPETPSNVPILKHLPPNASSLDVGAFACGSQTLFDGPLDGLDQGGVDSPHHGSCLTPSQLYTPTCSPHPQIRNGSVSNLLLADNFDRNTTMDVTLSAASLKFHQAIANHNSTQKDPWKSRLQQFLFDRSLCCVEASFPQLRY